jgi:hypothetical protein
MLHIASYHYDLLVEIHLYQGYFNMSFHWYMNMCYLIRLFVNVLIFFKRLLTQKKKQMSMKNVRMEKCLSI